MSKIDLPHADVVGSLLRPSELLEARRRRDAGQMSADDFRLAEDSAVEWAVSLQERVGLSIVTDGEMRRLSFQSLIPESIEGFGEYDVEAFLWGDWHDDASGQMVNVPRPSSIGVTDRLKRRFYPSVAEFRYLRGITNQIPKITMPSPSLFLNFWSPAVSRNAYPVRDAFLSDVARLIRDEIEQLVVLGARYIQLDAPHYPLVMDPKWQAFYSAAENGMQDWIAQGIELDNAVMDGFDEVIFALHL